MHSKIARLLLNFIISLALVLIVSEISVRIFTPQKSNYRCIGSNFDIPNALKPNCTITNDFYDKYFYNIKINKKGLRSNPAVSYQKPSNTFRILVLGDSITFGVGVNNEDLFTSILEQNLNQRISNRKFEVINASAPGWGPVEYYLYMKNEGYKYSSDLVIINQTVDDSVLLPQGRVDFKNLNYKQTSQNTAQIVFDNVFTRQQETSIYQLVSQSITSLPFYESFLNDFHIFTLIYYRLLQLGIEDKNAAIKKTAIYKLITSLKNRNVSEISWKIHNEEFKGPTSEETQKQIQYHFMMDALVSLILKQNSQILFLNSPTYQEVFKIVKKRESFNPFDKNNSIKLVEGMQSFQRKHAHILLFPKDLHWTPSGHRLAASFVFNHLITKNLITNFNQESHKLDLDDSELADQINSANKSLAEDLDTIPLWFFNKAMIYKNQNRIKLAIKTLNDYLKFYSEDKLGWLEMGNLQIKEDNKIEAIKSFQKSLNFSFEPNPKALFLIGKSYFELKQYDNSLKYLKKASQHKHSVLPEVYNHLAMIAHRKKNFGEAESYWKLAISENPDFSQYHRSLGNLYFDGQLYQKSLVEYKKSIELTPKQPKVLTLMGLAYAKLNQLEKAAKVFSKALELEPNNQIALSGLNFIKTFSKP